MLGCFYGMTKLSNEAALQILFNGWPCLNNLDFQVHKASSRKEKTECKNVIVFCQAALVDDAFRKDNQEILELTVFFLDEYAFLI